MDRFRALATVATRPHEAGGPPPQVLCHTGQPPNELARAVRDIRDLLKNRGDLSNHHVMSFDGDTHNEQERERWEQMVKEGEREQQEQDIPEESSD